MKTYLNHLIDDTAPVLIKASGFVTKGTGVGAVESTVAEVMFGAGMGAFIGVIVGLLATQLIRFAGLFAGRSYDKPYWTLGAAIAGAVIFGWIAAADQED